MQRREEREEEAIIPSIANVAFVLGVTEAACAQIKELRKRGRREKSKRREKRRGARACKHAYKLFLRKGGQRRNRGIKVVRSGCHSKLLQSSRVGLGQPAFCRGSSLMRKQPPHEHCGSPSSPAAQTTTMGLCWVDASEAAPPASQQHNHDEGAGQMSHQSLPAPSHVRPPKS